MRPSSEEQHMDLCFLYKIGRSDYRLHYIHSFKSTSTTIFSIICGIKSTAEKQELGLAN
jgi:hypothetical protein